ncbi:hypothetical protein RIF29_22029 [Crotalaria pallida]|uniref:Uncharacterized protein n=1 Tax=Crotalaria pallida TaxID=3830 RepID=A0AAN9IE18_CROPI
MREPVCNVFLLLELFIELVLMSLEGVGGVRSAACRGGLLLLKYSSLSLVFFLQVAEGRTCIFCMVCTAVEVIAGVEASLYSVPFVCWLFPFPPVSIGPSHFPFFVAASFSLFRVQFVFFPFQALLLMVSIRRGAQVLLLLALSWEGPSEAAKRFPLGFPCKSLES